MVDEYEVIPYPQINNLYAFLVTIEYRTLHLHRDVEVNLVVDGEISLLCNKAQYLLSCGDMVLVNSKEPHEFKTSGDKGATILSVQVSPKFWNIVFAGFDNIIFDSVKILDHFSKDLRNKITGQFIELAVCYLQKQPYYELQFTGLLNLFMHQLLLHIPLHIASSEERYANQKRMERLRRILDYIDTNYMHNLLLSDIADKENLTLSYLSHFIKDNLNQTFQELVNNLRFNHACKLLLSTNESLLDVCLESGFSDPKYLSKTFLQRAGSTPVDFRKKRQNITFETNVHHSSHSLEQFHSAESAMGILRTFENNYLGNSKHDQRKGAAQS